VSARDIHAAETAGYVRDLLQGLYRSEKTRVLIYSRQPYAAALESIAAERAAALELLRDAVDDGLLERLAAEKSDKDVAAAVEAGLFEQPDPAVAAAYRRQRDEVADADPVTGRDFAEEAWQRAEAEREGQEELAAEQTVTGGMGGAWGDPAVRRAVRETIAESEAGR